jgi:hypothetical protein
LPAFLKRKSNDATDAKLMKSRRDYRVGAVVFPVSSGNRLCVQFPNLK